MTIERIGASRPSYEPKRTTPLKKNETVELKDNVSISDTARQRVMEAKLQTEIKNISRQIGSKEEDTERLEKLKEIKTRLKNGEYDNLTPEVLNKVAGNIAESLLG
ncbi:MAG: flagellar biosynthesis anti-sigma factor FlgM [Leptospiraceae bacterium]|nr:flagellar biosynthesis anti-sigma factor FlgM [Leptospiraceae bacterium]MCK6382462.1 flagellar biosynthesis anti-sigma factor FlgM [Leptospiraceae bacterium]NUM40927.1 flagellar biosynthesis anti-sigma factor FlgM [Leptospiraceae bacterium]